LSLDRCASGTFNEMKLLVGTLAWYTSFPPSKKGIEVFVESSREIFTSTPVFVSSPSSPNSAERLVYLLRVG
jgi:hypothetical protein